jgi:hypothetical protein
MKADPARRPEHEVPEDARGTGLTDDRGVDRTAVQLHEMDGQQLLPLDAVGQQHEIASVDLDRRLQVQPGDEAARGAAVDAQLAARPTRVGRRRHDGHFVRVTHDEPPIPRRIRSSARHPTAG